jgi:hypothetical protein
MDSHVSGIPSWPRTRDLAVGVGVGVGGGVHVGVGVAGVSYGIAGGLGSVQRHLLASAPVEVAQ